MFRRQLFTLTALAQILGAAHFDDKVRNDFFAGFAGDKAAFERAMQTSSETIANNPNESAEAMAWHGAGLLVLAGQKFQKGDIAGGGELWGKANAEMDKAGQLEPNNPAVLIPRAAAWFAASRQSPPDMARPILEKALADYEHVYEIQRAYFDTLNVHMRSELLFGLADGHARAGNTDRAHLYFEKLAAIGPASGHLEQAQLFLAGEKYTVKGIGCAGCHTGN